MNDDRYIVEQKIATVSSCKFCNCIYYQSTVTQSVFPVGKARLGTENAYLSFGAALFPLQSLDAVVFVPMLCFFHHEFDETLHSGSLLLGAPCPIVFVRAIYLSSGVLLNFKLLANATTVVVSCRCREWNHRDSSNHVQLHPAFGYSPTRGN